MSGPKTINYLLVGYGYWGPNLARNINKNSNSELSIIIDTNKENLKVATNKGLAKFYLNNLFEITEDQMKDIDIVVIATPPTTHAQIIKSLAHYEKDFLVTKPVATSISEIQEIKKLLSKYDFEIFVDETFVYSNKVKKIKEIVNDQSFGDLQYIYSNRSNLGLIQRDHNVIWDLAPHDLSIISYITELYPEYGIATSSNPLKKFSSKDTIASVKFHYPTNIDFYLNLSWLSPEKLRYMVFSGTKKTLVYDDNLDQNGLTVYDLNISLENDNFIYEKDIGKKIDVEINEPLFDEINQLSFYKLHKKKKPFTIFENSIKNIYALENIKYV